VARLEREASETRIKLKKKRSAMDGSHVKLYRVETKLLVTLHEAVGLNEIKELGREAAEA
jgi:hypothetical protein